MNNILKKYDLKPKSYRKIGETTLIESDNIKYIIKKKKRDNKEIFDYLKSRNFYYYPKIVNEDENYEITEYIEQIDMPNEQKILDMIDLISLLHNKTTYYKEVDIEDYKKIYEDITNNINYLFSYYNDLITLIETKTYMSPSEYLLARNISIVFDNIALCKDKINNWYELVKNLRRQRQVVLHNNLQIDHFLKNDEKYLISWDKAKIDMPIFDLYKLYKKHGLNYDFEVILRRYEQNYPLLKEEKELLFILLLLPDKLEFQNIEYQDCKIISKIIDYIYKTRYFVLPYYSDNTNTTPEK
ncbi:MAG: hypothetical protein PHN42_01165 [Bacilli bacterium]|nr:hypothetical protein [Bacilli bacterium]